MNTNGLTPLAIDSFDKSPVHSEERFRHAMHLTNAPEWMKKAAEHICRSYGIKGQSDPAYIANMIDQYYEARDEQ